MIEFIRHNHVSFILLKSIIFAEDLALMKKPVCILFFLLVFQHLSGQIPPGYYNQATGKIQGDLKTALFQIISSGHTSNTYASLWLHFEKTDKESSGEVWDMYSDCNFQFVTDQCGNYSAECDCFNREHSVPTSWIGGEIYPMYADLHHIVPVDAWTNNKRSNYPFGQVGSVSWTSYNGSKLGTSNFPGYSGTVFEPVDEYKGDFARILFYMVTRYEHLISGWPANEAGASAVLDGTTWPAFNQWVINLYLQWHENDPVDMKEVSRNDSIFKIQNNRNPFIDHPGYARQIWGPDAGISNSQISCFSLFPMPFTDNITLSATTKEASVLKIYSVLGIVLYTFNIEHYPQTLDMSLIPPGMYVFRIHSDSQTYTMSGIKL